jgi:hypothetical protein
VALCYWQKVAKEGDQKIEEYSNFLAELEEEILQQLDYSTANARRP